jgi:hypothetical protein
VRIPSAGCNAARGEKIGFGGISDAEELKKAWKKVFGRKR